MSLLTRQHQDESPLPGCDIAWCSRRKLALDWEPASVGRAFLHRIHPVLLDDARRTFGG